MPIDSRPWSVFLNVAKQAIQHAFLLGLEVIIDESRETAEQMQFVLLYAGLASQPDQLVLYIEA
jgi:hypothetical protein